MYFSIYNPQFTNKNVLLKTAQVSCAQKASVKCSGLAGLSGGAHPYKLWWFQLTMYSAVSACLNTHDMIGKVCASTRVGTAWWTARHLVVQLWNVGRGRVSVWAWIAITSPVTRIGAWNC